MHAIDDQMHVVVVGVAMDRPYGLALLESQRLYHVLGDAFRLRHRRVLTFLPVDRR